MEKYTDTELLEKLLPMLNYSITTRADAVSVSDTIDFGILESNAFVSKSFVVALQDRMNELAKKTRVETANIIVDEDEDIECNKEQQEVNGTCMPAEDNKNYKERLEKWMDEWCEENGCKNYFFSVVDCNDEEE